MCAGTFICLFCASIERFKYLQYVYIIMSRSNTVRLSDEELDMLKEYRDNKYSGYVPLGFVIGDLVNNANKED